MLVKLDGPQSQSLDQLGSSFFNVHQFENVLGLGLVFFILYTGWLANFATN